MDRDYWILNIVFLIVLVVFIGLTLWLAAEADHAHSCLLDDACIEKYRAKIELEKKFVPTKDAAPIADHDKKQREGKLRDSIAFI